MLVSHSNGVLDVDTDDGDVVVGFVRLGVRLHVRDVHHCLHAAAHPPEHGMLDRGQSGQFADKVLIQTSQKFKTLVFHQFIVKPINVWHIKW